MSGVTGAQRIESRPDFQFIVNEFSKLVEQFSKFCNLTITGSFVSDITKRSFGDIDLIVQVASTDKKAVKVELIDFMLTKFPEKFVEFTNEKHIGKRYYNAGELVSFRFLSTLGYSVQIDCIIACSEDELEFKHYFLSMPAEKQGLLIGLVKTVLIENEPTTIFDKLFIDVSDLANDQEYEFNFSPNELQLRKVTYKPGTVELINKEIVWHTYDYNCLIKLLPAFDITKSFEELLQDIKDKNLNPRSLKRIVGMFKSMVSVKSGEYGTDKGKRKEEAIRMVEQLTASNTIVITFGRFNPPTKGHQLLIDRVKNLSKKLSCNYAVYVSRTKGTTKKAKLKDPLSVDIKISFLEQMFPDTNFVSCDDQTRTIIEILKYLNPKYSNLILVVGEDRVPAFTQLLNKQNGIDYNFESIEIISSGNRSETGEGVASISASKAREFVAENNEKEFKKITSSKNILVNGKTLFQAVKEAMEEE